MSNTHNCGSCKGSKHKMQNIVFKENQYILNELFSDKLVWLSPMKKDLFREYQLNYTDISQDHIIFAMTKNYWI